MNEIWRDVVGYEGLYRVSSTGKVYSILAGRILKTCISNTGYELVCLRSVDGKRHQKTVHRLVATAFVPNPKGLPIVNHKDEDKLNNQADNLEWCTYTYNNEYSGNLQKILECAKRKSIPCDIYTKDGELVRHFESIRAAARWLEAPSSNVTYAMQGNYKGKKIKTCKGYQVKPAIRV